ncbi:MAG: hypothetical protein ACLRFI_03455 [Alphaproteobacteria bacterium]
MEDKEKRQCGLKNKEVYVNAQNNNCLCLHCDGCDSNNRKCEYPCMHVFENMKKRRCNYCTEVKVR